MKIYDDVIQGSEEWHALRCGKITTSSINLILTPAKLQYAQNDKVRQHVWEIAAQRIAQYVEPSYIGDHMLRGKVDEILARDLYSEHYAPVTQVGFVESQFDGVTVGFSPDGLVGDDGVIEVKSRLQKYQLETICAGEMPAEYALQVQTALMVSGRVWCDFISYCAGMPMTTIRVYRDEKVIAAILEACKMFDAQVEEKVAAYRFIESNGAARLIPTERTVEMEMFA